VTDDKRQEEKNINVDDLSIVIDKDDIVAAVRKLQLALEKGGTLRDKDKVDAVTDFLATKLGIFL
jgi:hypothetical protein